MENIKFSFPPSANWFSTNCIDVSCKGVVAFASLKDVTISNESNARIRSFINFQL